MSIQDAIITATKDILSSYLAPELVDQLSDDIMHRAAPEIESALTEFAGFDFGKAATRGKGAGITTQRPKAGNKTSRKRKEAGEHGHGQDPHDESDSMAMGSVHKDAEPAPQDMA